MAKKHNGNAKGKHEETFSLAILDAEQFKSLEDVQAFLRGDGLMALRCTIQNALLPEFGGEGRSTACLGELGREARLAAWYLVDDLAELARVAAWGKPAQGAPREFPAFGPEELERHRRALLFVALASEEQTTLNAGLHREIVAQLLPQAAR